MKTYIKLVLILIICLLIAGCVSKEISNKEIQNVRNSLSGEWVFTKEYIASMKDSEYLKDYIIVISKDGTWYKKSKTLENASPTGIYNVDYAYDDKYSVDFFFKDNPNSSFIGNYAKKGNYIFQVKETAFTTKISYILKRK